jgi:hypothetical protein
VSQGAAGRSYVRPATLEEYRRVSDYALSILLGHEDVAVREAAADALHWATHAAGVHIDQLPESWRRWID